MRPIDDRPFRPEQPEQSNILKIAIGVALGILIAGLVTYAVRMYFVQQALNQFQQSMQEINKQTQRSVQEMQQREQLRQQGILESANQQRLEKAEMQRQQEISKRQHLEAVETKEQAWQRFYKKPAHCGNADGQAFVDCANGYIRAKREFEKQYAAGKL